MAGRWITPGLIDVHTHGALGHTFNEPTEAAFGTILAENLRRGVTGLVATVGAAPFDEMKEIFTLARQWMAESHSGTPLLGVHLESPYINPVQAGALDRNSQRLPTDGSAEQLLEFADVLRIFVLAPELPGAAELTARLTERGVIVAAGHSMAKEQDILAAMQAGLTACDPFIQRHVHHRARRTLAQAGAVGNRAGKPGTDRRNDRG